jgi:hypothetical protein
MQLRSGKQVFDANHQKQKEQQTQKDVLVGIIRRYLSGHYVKAHGCVDQVHRYKEKSRVFHELYFIIEEHMDLLLANHDSSPEIRRLARMIRFKAVEFIDAIIQNITHNDFYVEKMSKHDFQNQLNLKRLVEKVVRAIPANI